MSEPVIVETKSVNGNPWWVVYHDCLMAYEVQINPRTKNILIGAGPVFPTKRIFPCSKVLDNEEIQNYIRSNLTKKVLDSVLKKCEELNECN